MFKLDKHLQSLGNPKDAGHKIGEFETLRQISTWTGEVFPAQRLTLAATAKLLCDQPVTITMNLDSKHITFKSKGKADDIKLSKLVATVLGPGWTIKNDTGTMAKGRKTTKSKGTGRAKKNR